jgi:glycosyltransferase involved in cell wall biosynthesis
MSSSRSRILIAGCVSVFTGREELHLTQVLSEAIRRLGHQVDMFMLPVVNNPLLIPEQMMSLRLLDVKSSSDILLTVGYPAFALKHPHKRVLLFSLSSSLHEHFGTEYGVLSTPQYRRIRAAVYAAEQKCLMEAERVLCASEALAAQIQAQYHLPAKAVMFNSNLNHSSPAGFFEEGTWVVCESTLEPSDRMDLLLNAVTHAREQWQLMIFVPSASDVYKEALHQRIEQLGLKKHVVVKNSALSLQDGAQQAKVFAALPFTTTRIPEGLLQAIKCHIPVVTASDCGAVLEVTQNERNGLVVEPSASEIARAMDLLVSDTKLHQRLSHGYGRLNRKPVPIEKLVESLAR